jgi:hypothetical protein
MMLLVGSDYENDVADAFKDIERAYLAKNTSLYALLTAVDYSSKHSYNPLYTICVENVLIKIY